MWLTEMPKECISKILSYVDAQSLSRVLQTCTRLSRIAGDNLIWLKLAEHNYPNALDEVKLLNQSDKFSTVCGFYRQILLHAGQLFGIWQMDYSFFHGGLLRVRLVNDNDIAVIGELIVPNDRPAVDGVVQFSMDHRVPIDLSTRDGYTVKPLFVLRLKDTTEYPTRIECTKKEGSIRHYVDINWIDVQGVVDVESSSSLSAADMSERISANGT
jgi:F-box-like